MLVYLQLLQRFKPASLCTGSKTVYVCLRALRLGPNLVSVCTVLFPVCPLTLFPSDRLQGHLRSGMQPCAGDHLIGVTSGLKLARGI